MPWKEETVENQRRSFCARANAYDCNFSALCRARMALPEKPATSGSSATTTVLRCATAAVRR